MGNNNTSESETTFNSNSNYKGLIELLNLPIKMQHIFVLLSQSVFLNCFGMIKMFKGFFKIQSKSVFRKPFNVV